MRNPNIYKFAVLALLLFLILFALAWLSSAENAGEKRYENSTFLYSIPRYERDDVINENEYDQKRI